MELHDRTALVTGATAGIGEAVAAALHDAGMRLVVSGRRAERIAALEARWPGAVGLAADIADPAVPQRLVELALERTGRLDVVINNAGLMTVGDIESIDIEGVCAMARVNVEASFRMVYTALRHFKAVGAGNLISTSSVLGTKARKLTGGYCATKAAIEMLTEALRMELAGTPIRVACVEPAFTETELFREHAVSPGTLQGINQGLTPEDVARSVLFMLQQPAHVKIPRLFLIPADQEI